MVLINRPLSIENLISIRLQNKKEKKEESAGSADEEEE